MVLGRLLPPAVAPVARGGGGGVCAAQGGDEPSTAGPAARERAGAPPPITTRQEGEGIRGSGAEPPPAPRTARVVMRTAWPSSRLMPTATTSANAVHTGALHPKPAFAFRHQKVR